MKIFQQDIFSGIKKRGDYWIIALIIIATWVVVFITGVWSPSTIRIDGVDPICYFSYLHSVCFDGDLNFENEYHYLNENLMKDIRRSPNGYPTNSFSIGPAILLAPAYLLTHIEMLIETKIFKTTVLADGLSFPYQAACVMMLPIYGLAGLLFLFSFLKFFFNRQISLAASIIIYFSTNLIYYCFPQTLMPHSVSFFGASLFLYFFFRLKNEAINLSAKSWLFIGGLLGLAALIRWQNALLIVFPIMLLPEIKNSSLKNKDNYHKTVICCISFIFAYFLIFSPQMIAWHIINGKALTIPQGRSFLNFGNPALLKILFSTYNGLFSWHPITLISLCGVILFLKRELRYSSAMLLFFLLQYYLNASTQDWHGSWGFGMRRFDSCLPIFAFGLAALFDLGAQKSVRLKYLVFASSIFIVWNLLFLTQFYLRLIPDYRPLTYHEMAGQKLQIFRAINRKAFVKAANTLIKRKDLDRAKKAIELAVELEPESSEALGVAGNLYLLTGNYQAAISYYQKALETDTRGEWMFGLGKAYYMLGDFEQARYYLQMNLKRGREMSKEARLFLDQMNKYYDKQ